MTLSPFKMKDEDKTKKQLISELAELRQQITEFEASEDEGKQAEEALRASEARYQDLYHNAPDMFFSVEVATGKIVQCNRTLKRVTGYSGKELIGRYIFDIYHPDCLEDVKQVRQSFIQTGEVRDTDLQLKRKDRSKIEVSLNISAVRDDRGRIVRSRAILRDITERKQAEKQLLAYQNQLKSLASKLTFAEQRERQHIAAGLHDGIGQTLAAIRLKLATLRQSVPSRELKKSLDGVYDLLGRAIREARSLTFQLNPPLLDLGLEEAVESLCEQIQEEHDFLVKFEDDRQSKPLSDDARIILFQAVRELLVNVAKHARADRVKVSIRGGGDTIRLTVEDDGLGFDPSAVYTAAGGTGGFGLFNVREQLDHLGGHYVIESKPGEGTRVIMVAPLEP